MKLSQRRRELVFLRYKSGTKKISFLGEMISRRDKSTRGETKWRDHERPESAKSANLAKKAARTPYYLS
jgi:hypothetical protein